MLTLVEIHNRLAEIWQLHPQATTRRFEIYNPDSQMREEVVNVSFRLVAINFKQRKTTMENDDPSKAMRYNAGKPKFSLIIPRFMRYMACVLTMGAEKYDEYNWQKSCNTEHHNQFRDGCLDSLQRHLNYWHEGDQYDEESGLPHMAHVAVNAMFIEWYDHNEKRKAK